MATIITENFDSMVAGTLSGGWSFNGSGTGVPSTTQKRSGTQSLQLAPSNNYSQAWKAGVVDNPVKGIWAEAWFKPTGSGGPSSYLLAYLHLRSTTPSGAGQPDSMTFRVSLWGTDPGHCGIQNITGGVSSGLSTGVFPAVAGATNSSMFPVTDWYRLVATLRDSADRSTYTVDMSIQRDSDGFWLDVSNTTTGWTQSTDRIIVTSYFPATNINTDNRWWQNGALIAIGCYGSPGNILYADDFLVQDYPAAPAQNTWTPGNSVELIPAAITSDAGGGTGVLANLNDGSFATNWVSTNRQSTFILFDLGAGNTAIPTRVLYGASTATSNTNAFPLNGDWRIEGANSLAGPWTTLGTVPPESVYLWVYTPIPLVGSTAYRYVRLIAPTNYLTLSELRLEGQIVAGTPLWQPVRPTIAPGAGRYAAGQSVTITTPTTGASAYDTTNGTTPTTGSTLYTGALTLPTIASGASYTVKAIAYHASGTASTTSAVAQAVFNPAEFVPDTGAAPATFLDGETITTSVATNWPQDGYDDSGTLLQGNTGHAQWDANLNKFAWIGGVFCTNPDKNDYPRGLVLYTSSDTLNWHREGIVIPPSPQTVNQGSANTYNYYPSQTRPHWIYNASPIDPNKAYVAHLHLYSGYEGVGVVTAPSLRGPWTWQKNALRVSTNTNGPGDLTLFTDPATGYVWLVYNAASTNGMWMSRLDPATDYTTFVDSSTVANANNIQLIATGSSAEAPVMFMQGSYYFLIVSNSTPYGAGNTAMTYKSATTLGGLYAASLTSIWSSVPTQGGPLVTANAQPTCYFRLPGRKGGILMCELMDAKQNSGVVPNNYHDRAAWYPVPDSAISGGTLSLTQQTAWNLSALPLSATAFGRRFGNLRPGKREAS